MEYVKEEFNPELDLRKNDVDRCGKISSGCNYDDPDAQSRLQKNWHILLWNKDNKFNLKYEDRATLFDEKKYGSDYMNSCYTYYNEYKKSDCFEKCKSGIEAFESLTCTIGNFIIFPKDNSINKARGFSSIIKDRFDLTLECIRRFYLGNDEKENPLYATLKENKCFFEKFNDFKEYVEFFLLQDMVENGRVKFFTSKYSFEKDENLPFQSKEMFAEYIENVSDFIKKRGERMKKKVAKL